MDILVRIKRLVLQGAIRYTLKAFDEMAADGLQPTNVVESILNAETLAKSLRSRAPQRRGRGERLYVIKSNDYSGTFIYTKGRIDREAGQEFFYILISAKIAT